MFEMERFQPAISKPRDAVDTYDDVSKDMDVFQRSEEQFLPEGKTFEDLTDEELAQLKRQYRFDYYKPGIYQGITWIANNKHRSI